MTNSLDVAALFGRLHKNVLQGIDRLECSPEFNRLNFQPVEYRDAKGEARQSYNMAKDGFTFLAMGFKGALAAKFKEAYIARFNEMEEQLKQYEAPRDLGKVSLSVFQYDDQPLRTVVSNKGPMFVAVDVESCAPAPGYAVSGDGSCLISFVLEQIFEAVRLEKLPPASPRGGGQTAASHLA